MVITTLKAATIYADLGWPVFPIRAASKVPAVTGGFKAATTNTTQIERWFGNGSNLGVGLPVPPGLLVIDVDPQHGGDDTLNDLVAEHGPLPPTPTVWTGGGGSSRHLYFRHRGAEKLVQHSIGPGVDLRLPGRGYVCAPPTRHSSGRRYKWDCPIGDIGNMAPAPAWFIDRIKQRAKVKIDWVSHTQIVHRAGSRNSAVAKLAGYLLRNDNIWPQITLELLLGWSDRHCDPPLGDAEVFRIVDSIAGIELRRRQRGDGK